MNSIQTTGAANYWKQGTEDRRSWALHPFTITYSPAHLPNGTPVDRYASRQTLAQRLTTTVYGINAESAVDQFERQAQRMATACTRMHMHTASHQDQEQAA